MLINASVLPSPVYILITPCLNNLMDLTTVECSLCHPNLCTGIDFIDIGVPWDQNAWVSSHRLHCPLRFCKSARTVEFICLSIRHETNLGHTNLLDTVLTKSKTISVSISPILRPWVVNFYLRLCRFHLPAYICLGLLLTWMFNSENNAPFHWASRTGICQRTFQIVCNENLWLIRGSYQTSSLSQMLNDILKLDHTQWHPPLIILYTI